MGAQRPHRGWLVRVALVGLLSTLVPAAQPARAAVLVVNSLADDNSGSAAACVSGNGTCTLRAALAAAANGDTISFAFGGTIDLQTANGPLLVTTSVTIQGPLAGTLVVDGQKDASSGGVPVFRVNSGVQATIDRLTITNGRGESGIDGGGILNSGTLTLTNSTISNNITSAQMSGGGIANGGTLTVLNSTFSANSASGFFLGGGGIANSGILTVTDSTFVYNTSGTGGGGIANEGTLTVTNSTFANNSANSAGRGGGIINFTTRATITNSTFADNSASIAGGAMFNFSGNSMRLRNSIVVRSPGGNCDAAIISLGNNLSDTTECFPGGTQGDVVSPTPLLGALAIHAPGTTATYALLPGSPAIDGVTFNPVDCPGGPLPGPGTPTPITTDQRGVTRPQVRTAARCDIGAFELEGTPTPTLTSTPNAMATAISGTATAFALTSTPPPTATPTITPTPTVTGTATRTATPTTTLTPLPNVPTSTVTPTPTPSPTSATLPNPLVTAVAHGDGRLRVTVTFPLSTASCTDSPRLVFEASSVNGAVDIGAVVGRVPPFEQPLGPGTQQVVFFVRRVTPNQPTTVELHTVDACGRSWPTFVGGGPTAF